MFAVKRLQGGPKNFHFFALLALDAMPDFPTTSLSRNNCGATQRKILLQMVKGHRYIYSQKFIYLDVKPGNVLISRNNSAVIKLADFGVSRVVANGSKYFTRNRPGRQMAKWSFFKLYVNIE